MTAWHPVVAAYRADADRHEVSHGSLARATRILQALAAEAARRGYDVKGPEASILYGRAFSKPAAGHLQIVIAGFSYRLRLREHSTPGGTRLPYGRQRDRLPRWQQARHTEFIPTGKLRIAVEEGYARDGRQAEFRDTKRAPLEEHLPAIFRELQIRAAEDDHRRQQQQRRAEEKRRRWEQAMEQARHDYRQDQLAQALHKQLQQWQLGKQLDDYLTELQASIPATADGQQQVAAAEWLDWARQYRQAIDPLDTPPSMPPTPKPAPADLEPFLQGWSPYGPGD